MKRFVLALLVATFAKPAQASTPAIGAVRPPGAQRGNEVEITLSGARLGDAQQILWYRTGIETLGFTKVDDNNVKVKLKLAADCPLGIHEFRLRTATGVSELRQFSIGALPETNETEPNNEFLKPQPITLGCVVNGIADNEDVDYFVLEAKKGQRVTAEVEGIRLGITHFDPYVAILNEKRFELSSSDDEALVRVDGLASIVAPEDGKYIIQVRESAYAGNGACLYRLHVGSFPRPKALLPAGGKLGEKVQVKWIGDPAGDIVHDVQLPAQPESNFGLYAQDGAGIAPNPNPFRLCPFGNVLEVEPNDDQAHATPFEAPLAVNGVIDKPGDMDHFAFPAKKGQAFDIVVYARRLRSPLDPVLHLVKVGGNYIAGADDTAGPDTNIRFTAPEDGQYEFYLHDHLQKGGPTYFYRVEVTPIEPKLTLYPQGEHAPNGYPNISVAVPKGGRQAILMYASRLDWGGDLKVAPAALPGGVEIEADVMPANQPVVPVLFKAAPDAAVGGLLTPVIGTPVDPNTKLASQQFEHNSIMVFGANNVDFWSRTVDRLAVAVTEECPYQIEVVEPKVPLVNSGQMSLKVVATRKEGFKAPISVYFPWLPPGVGASGGIQIPEGQNEALIPMNAGGAEARSWKLVVHGDSSGPTGPVRVSSQLFSLRIDQPYVQLAYNNTACEQGKETDLAVKVTKVKDWEGEATITLVGLPNKAETEVKKITKETADFIFHIKTTAETPAGNHASLFSQVVITENGEPITHNLGTAALRVDVPIPPKADAAPMPAAAPAEAPKPAAEPAKPLSRLEQLRKEAADKAKK